MGILFRGCVGVDIGVYEAGVCEWTRGVRGRYVGVERRGFALGFGV